MLCQDRGWDAHGGRTSDGCPVLPAVTNSAPEPKAEDARPERRPTLPLVGQSSSGAEEGLPIVDDLRISDVVCGSQVHDAVEEREAKLVEGVARAEDGGAEARARGVDEQEAEDLDEDVLREGQKSAGRGHGQVKYDDVEVGDGFRLWSSAGREQKRTGTR